ncbi:acyl-CoA dehydrogenase family protein [Streptomyces sp. NPDC051776]|uniref:acyl-CoA dehydrogenase family protein n=1 Tax=Streptomyces sp. NPDC051776 TaxID=3155414 RepID=UPI00341A493E
MDAAFTAEQDEIRRTLRELLLKRCGPEEVKRAVRTPDGRDGTLWRLLAEQLGLPGLALPAEYGGVGCGPTELALACEETGRALLPSPLLATAVLAAPLIARLGTEEQRSALLPPIARGELTAALALPGRDPALALGLTGDNGSGSPGPGQGSGSRLTGDGWAGGGRAGGVQARRTADGWRLYGQADRVFDGHSAGLLLVAAHTGGYARSRTSLFVVRSGDGGTAGLTRTRRTALDETRPQARIELRDVEAELLGEDERGAVALDALARLGGSAAAALAAEAVGAADGVFARTVEYVGAREQFGRPIGSFQAVKHRLADLYVRIQAARSAAYYAAWAAGQEASGEDRDGRHGQDRDGRHGQDRLPGRHGQDHRHGQDGQDGQDGANRQDGDAGAVGGLALAQALEAQRAVAGEAVQLHGGIGFTWEHDTHLFFKRAASDELLFGPVHRLRARAAERAGLFGAARAVRAARGAAAEGVAV